MHTKKKKEFNRLVQTINDRITNTNCLLLEYNDKHIRKKIEEKIKNPYINAHEIMALYIKPADIKNCQVDLEKNSIKYTELILDNYAVTKFYIEMIDEKTFHTNVTGIYDLRSVNSPRGEHKIGNLSATTKYITLMTAFYIDCLKKIHK